MKIWVKVKNQHYNTTDMKYVLDTETNTISGRIICDGIHAKRITDDAYGNTYNTGRTTEQATEDVNNENDNMISTKYRAEIKPTSRARDFITRIITIYSEEDKVAEIRLIESMRKYEDMYIAQIINDYK